MKGKYRLATLGCKVNQYESQQFRELLESAGLRRADAREPADLAVVNTCAVTTSACAKSRQTIRRLARDAMCVVVVGCGATADAPRLSRIPGVAGVWGHGDDAANRIRNLLATRRWNETPEPSVGHASPGPGGDARSTLAGGDARSTLAGGDAHATEPGTDARATNSRSGPDDEWMMPENPAPGGSHSSRSRTDVAVVAGGDSSSPALESTHSIVPDPLPIVNLETPLGDAVHGFEDHHRAYIKVQDGCDAFCTYCIIPQLRPAPQFKPIDAVVAEAAGLVRAGYREIVLTGIFLGAYGRETAIRRRFQLQPVASPLAELVDAVAQVPGLERLRLSSLEPGDVDEALLDALSANDNCVPHLHLPLQSGSADVLRRMNRQYTRDQFVDMVDRVRAALDRPAISTDIIVGFPGEDERSFAETLDVARHAEFCKIHAFPFSPRPGTAAARWGGRFVPPPIVKARMARLSDLERASSLSFRRRLVGSVERVLVEHQAEVDNVGGAGEHLYDGRCDRYFRIHFQGRGLRPGEIASVRLDHVTATRSHGTHVAHPDNGLIALPVLGHSEHAA